METLFTGKIQYFESEIGSTNDWAVNTVRSSKVIEGTLFRAGRQNQGRGQRGRVWDSNPNSNLLVSYVFYPHFVKLEQQFVLVQLVSLALKDVLSKLLIDEVKIKWPNDIYINDLKIAGVLIESSSKGSFVGSSVFGIGLNVNQRNFENAPNATSVILETGRGGDLEMLISELSFYLEKRYLSLRVNVNSLKKEYEKSLYRNNELSQYLIADKRIWMTQRGVDELGQVLLEDELGRINSYGLHQARMVI